ncbi:hypothetical protein BDV12DRAFT_181447 [Aspergillus spectabilis]
MKSSYIIAVLLPLATQLATATPTAGRDHDDHDYYEEVDNSNPCEVKVTYPYYKYPCSSSPENGTSLLGATFTSFCKYQNDDSGIWYAAPRGWVKEDDKPRKCPGASNPCPA